MSLSHRLKERREELGLDVMDVARRCKVTRSAVYAWESGDTKGLKPSNLVTAAELLKTYEKWLVTGTGPKIRAIRGEELSTLESKLIDDFRDLFPDEKTGIQTAVSALAEQHRKKKGRP